jgi:hypothetical protein
VGRKACPPYLTILILVMQKFSLKQVYLISLISSLIYGGIFFVYWFNIGSSDDTGAMVTAFIGAPIVGLMLGCCTHIIALIVLLFCKNIRVVQFFIHATIPLLVMAIILFKLGIVNFR